MAGCEPGPIKTGGLWGEEMDDLHVVVMKPYLEIVGEYYKRAVMEKAAHKDTLLLLAQVVAGEIPLGVVVVTPDGWQIKRARPSPLIDVKSGPTEEVSPNGANASQELEHLSQELEHLSASS